MEDIGVDVVRRITAEMVKEDWGTYNEIASISDWEQRRYEIAKSAMQGILADKNSNVLYNSDVARKAVEYADALIAELKGK